MARSPGAFERGEQPARPIGFCPPAALRLLALLTGFALTAISQTPDVLEYRVKAAILYNITRFVEWPAGPPATADTFTLCLAGDDPFGAILDETFAGKRVAGRRVVLSRRSAGDAFADCQLLFVGPSEKRRVEQIIQALDNRPVLTLSEIPQFANRGGTIHFFMDDGRVRFEINVGGAEAAGLRIRSQLLELVKVRKQKGRN